MGLIKFNQRLSRNVAATAIIEVGVFAMYVKVAGLLLTHPNTTRVLDAGAGAAWVFPPAYKKMYGIHLIGVDIDNEEMAQNYCLDERIVSDVCKEIPVPAGSVDLITAFSGIEHFPDNAGFLKNCHAALKDGGRLVAQFPSRYAVFAIFNRILPTSFAQKLVRWLRPDAAGHIGFKAAYDRTNYSSFKKIAEQAGFTVEYHYPGYFHFYFAFFFPLYLLSLAYGFFCMTIGTRDYASYNLFVLRKAGPADILALGQKRYTAAES